MDLRNHGNDDQSDPCGSIGRSQRDEQASSLQAPRRQGCTEAGNERHRQTSIELTSLRLTGRGLLQQASEVRTVLSLWPPGIFPGEARKSIPSAADDESEKLPGHSENCIQ